MRFGIGAKLGLLASTLIIATVLLLAWLMMSWSKDALTRQELAALGDETRLRGEEVLHGLQNLREDALRQAGRSALREFLQAAPHPPAPLQEKVRKDFRDLLAEPSAYLQVEYLPPDNGAGALSEARDPNVHIDSKAQLSYFLGLAETKDNAVWLSAARRTAHARIGDEEVPVLRAAAPLFVADRYAGAVVITADFRKLARGLGRSARHLVYLTDEQGRFLWAPDPGQAFAFEQGNAPHIYDDLLPDLKPFYKAEDGAPPQLTRWRGYRYPGSDKDGVALGRYVLLRLEAVKPEDWRTQKDLHEKLDSDLEKLPAKDGVAGSRSDDPTRVVILRGRDEGRLQDTARMIVERFAPHLKVGKQKICEHYAVHFFHLPYTAPGSPPHWFGLAQGVAREEIVAGVNDKTAGVIWLKLALITVGVAVAFLLSRRLTRPLQRITEATRNLAQGEGEGDLDLPVKASDEIGVLARCFKDMVEQLRQRGQQLREGEARLRVILKTAAEGIFILDDDGTIQMVNQAAERLFGYAAEELKGRNVKLLLPKEVQGLPRADGSAPVADAGISSIRLGRVNNRTQEAVGRRKDGSLFTLELSVSDVPVGERRLYTGIVRDVTERKKAEAEIRELNQHLRELNDQLDRRVRERTRQLERTNDELAIARDQALDASRAKSQFLAQMSHELRTPLNAIKGYSELLLEEAEEHELHDFVPDLKKIIEAGKHLLALINDVLDLSKIEAHKVELFLESFDVEALVQAVVSTVAPAAKKNGNELVVHCQGAGSMYADRTRVRQVLLNLLSNACKFTHEGRVELEVVREPCHGREGLAFRVRDTGIGIRPEQLDKLFKPFSQIDDATTRKHDGTGLGLAISRSFCQMMGGDITVTSDYGKGSLFTAHLPVQVTDVPEAQSAAPVGSPQAGTVLVVDDDPAVRDLMQRYLDKEGFRAVTAANGREGLRLARQLRPRAITLDVLMPGMDGWDVLSALKSDPGTASIPVIMLTIADDRGLGRALGADEYMTKPIDRDRLTEVLKRYQSDTTASRER
jgi:PAS domain S-box-containing protein